MAASFDRESATREAHDLIRQAEREALNEFVRRYAWVERGEAFVGTRECPVPATLAVDLTIKALWRHGK